MILFQTHFLDLKEIQLVNQLTKMGNRKWYRLLHQE
mgnify:CR=1 FL=1